MLQKYTFRRKANQRRRDESIQTWRNHFFNEFFQMREKGTNGKWYNITDWIYGKEVRVFRTPEVSEAVVPYVKAGIQDLIDQIGLDFEINYYGAHLSTTQQVRQATRSYGQIDGEKLAKILIAEDWRDPEQGGTPHADVIITDRYLALGDENWGQSEFNKGYLLLSLPGKRQESLDFIRSLTKHEAGHLFGFQEHHDGLCTGVRRYKPVRDCNMKWEASTRYTCDKCADALTYFWKGVEARTGKKFLK